MIKIYDQDGAFGYQIGSCENGKVYRDGKYPKEQIGSYENGDVYSGDGWSKKRIGGYDKRGNIYEQDFFDKPVAEVKKGDVVHTKNFFETSVGKVSNDIGGAAAAFLLFPDAYYKEEASSRADSGNADENYSVGKILKAAFLGMFKFAWKVIQLYILLFPIVSLIFGAHGNVFIAGFFTLMGNLFVGLPNLAIVVLNFVLAFRCRKQGKKMWPVYAAFLLYWILSGLCSIYSPMYLLYPFPVILFQVIVLIRMNRKKAQ